MLWNPPKYISKHPSDNVISATASHFFFSVLLFYVGKKTRIQKQKEKQCTKICQNIYVLMLSFCTYQSFSENLHCKCFRNDKIFIFIWAATFFWRFFSFWVLQLRFTFKMRSRMQVYGLTGLTWESFGRNFADKWVFKIIKTFLKLERVESTEKLLHEILGGA